MGYLAQIFRNVNQSQQLPNAQKHLPMFNDITQTYSQYFSTFGQSSKKRKFMALYKSTPELVGLVRKVAKDMVYRYHFETINPKESGRNKIQKAERFAQEVVLRKCMVSQVIDQLVTGEGYGWIGAIKEEVIRKEIGKRIKKELFLRKSEQKILGDRVLTEMKLEGFNNIYKIDEDVLKPRKYRYMASSSMEVVYDQYDILHYNQVVGMDKEHFSTDEVIRYTLEETDGRVNGFTPIESIIVQIELLRMMWQNLMSLHKNGGAPDKVFILKNLKPGDPSYERIEEQLKKYKLVENKHGNMLFSGDVGIEDLQQLDKMQFMDSGLYITGLMALQWEIPRSSIPYIVGGTNTKDDTGGNSEKGYWRNIEQAQQLFADTMNTQLWIPYFGVKIVFDNAYVQQDVQIETALNLKYNNIVTMDTILNKGKKQLSETKRMELLKLTDEDVEDFDPMEEVAAMAEINGGVQKQLSDGEVKDSDDKKNKNQKKKDEQTSATQSRGMKPSGVGKELLA